MTVGNSKEVEFKALDKTKVFINDGYLVIRQTSSDKNARVVKIPVYLVDIFIDSIADLIPNNMPAELFRSDDSSFDEESREEILRQIEGQ